LVVNSSAILRPAIIVFAREPIPGRTKRRLIPAIGAEGAAMLAEAFISDAITKAARIPHSRLVIAADSPRGARSAFFLGLARRYRANLIDQGRGDLGARMARALHPYASRGAILLGTDTPSVPLAILRASIAILAHTPVVIAPALDGGYYLVGVRGTMPDIFRAIRWGRGSVLADTLVRLRNAGQDYELGPWWYDVDRAADLALLSAHLKHRLNFRLSAAMPLPRALPCPATRASLARLGL
jgi:rSAM/selenodomain-associated transferase 1